MNEQSVSFKKNALLFLHGQTPMHPGSGTALGVVDMPIQRERHTGWPVIPGSGLKGILRDACREKIKKNCNYDRRQANEDKNLTAVFGPGLVDDNNSYAGALVVTDARILAFPVRSLKGVFAWVTCPGVISRLSRDAGLAGMSVKWLSASVNSGQALCSESSPLLLRDGSLVLEEFQFNRGGKTDVFINWIAEKAVKDESTRRRLQASLVVLNDDDFTHFVRHATEVSARIGLDYEKKTAKRGALFYEEFLPSETLFYAVIIASGSRNNCSEMTADKVIEYVNGNLPPILQIGADETIGKGLCVPNLVLNGGVNHE